MKKLVCGLSMVLVLVLMAGTALAADSITVFNCYDYIDENLLYEFTDETGIDVQYVNYTTNEEMYVKLMAGATSYDVIFPSDYMIERMVKQDLLAELNFENIPNADGIMDWLKDPSYDEGSAHSVPYMWGTLGIIYNPAMVEEPIDSWEQMFSDTYKNNVIMMDSIRDTLGVTLKMLGYSMNTRDEAQLEEAKQKLIDQKQRGIVKAYYLDETKDKMIAGEAAMAMIYSGDAMYAMSENPDLVYVVPKEGSNVWIDCMVVPRTSQKQEQAEQFINYLCRPDVAARNVEWIGYCTPIQQVVDEMSEEDKANTTLNPPQDVIDNCEFFSDILDVSEMYDEMWTEIRGA